MHTAIVEPRNATGNAKIHVADLYVGICSASTMALRTHSAAWVGSTISPLRTPRRAPGRCDDVERTLGFCSPTTTQTSTCRSQADYDFYH